MVCVPQRSFFEWNSPLGGGRRAHHQQTGSSEDEKENRNWNPTEPTPRIEATGYQVLVVEVAIFLTLERVLSSSGRKMDHADAALDELCLSHNPLVSVTATNSITNDFDISAKFPSGFSLALLQRLQSSRAKFDAFIDSTICRVEDAGKENTKFVREKQNEIDTLLHTLHQLKLKRGVVAVIDDDDDESNTRGGGVAAQRRALEEARVRVEQNRSQLNQQIDSVKKQIDSLTQEKEKFEKEVNFVREKKRAVELQKDTRIEDLTKGVMLYKLLGLDFEKVDDDLWFRFTHLDPKDPLRQFSFALTMVNGDTYQVNGCNPDLPQDSVNVIVQQLNQSNNASTAITSFVRSMRRAFKKHYIEK